MKKLFTAMIISIIFSTIGFAGSLRLNFPEDEPPSQSIIDQLLSFLLPAAESMEGQMKNQLQPLIDVGTLGNAFENCPSTVTKIVEEKNIDIALDSARQNCIRIFRKMKDFYASQGIEEEDGEDECCAVAIEELLKAYSPGLLIKAEAVFEAYVRGDYSRTFEFTVSENLAGSSVCPKGEVCL
jgi:hypothetical protein